MGQTPEAAPRATRRLRAWAIGLAVAFATFGLLGFLAGPPLARTVLLNALTAQLHRTVTLGGIRINPYALTLRVNDLRVAAPDGSEVFGFDELYVDVSLSSALRLAPVVEELRLTAPRVHLVRAADGSYNISDLLAQWMAPSTSPTPPFSLNNITVTKGRISFDDKPAGRRHEVTNLSIALPFISNLPHQAERFTEPAFSCVVNGAPFKLDGKTRPFSPDRESELALALKGLNIAAYLAYAPLPPAFSVEGGTLDADLRLVFRQPPGKPAELSLAGTAVLAGLKLADTDGRPLATLQRLTVPMTGVAPLAGSLAFGDIAIEGLEVFVRSTRGGLNWQDLARRLAAAPPAKPAAKGAAPVKGVAKGAPGNPLVLAAKGLRLESLALRWENGPQATLKHFGLKNVKADAGAHAVNIGAAEASGLELSLVRQADGSIAGLEALTRSSANAPANALANAPANAGAKGGKAKGGTAGKRPGADAGWNISVGATGLSGLALRLEDRSLRRPATQDLAIEKLTLGAMSTAPGATANLELVALLNKTGELRLSGPVGAQPVSATLKTDIRGFGLLPLQPYFGKLLNLIVTRGELAAQGVLTLSTRQDGGLTGGWSGQASLNGFHSVERATSTDFLAWKSLHVAGVEASFAPRSLNIDEVALSDFYAKLVVSPKGRLNLLDLARPNVTAAADSAPSRPAAGTPAEAASVKRASAKPDAADSGGQAPPAEPAMPVRIARVTLQGGAVNFTDNFIKPHYSARLASIGGRINGLSTEEGSKAQMELRGDYDGAPLRVSGSLNPLSASPSLDLKAEVRGVELTAMSPYAGKYAGYNIEKGKLSLFLNYRIADRKLNAENRVFLDQLTFGDKVNSPDATKLPVTLAVALLKNSNGEIDINLPISGSLEDPDFSVGGIVARVIVNLLVKAVTSPFALLGSLFGGGEELSCVVFDPGSASLGADGEKRLAALAKALADRPGLTLEVAGRVDAVKDAEGLRQADLQRQVKARKLARLVRGSKPAGGVDEVRVEAKEYDDLLAEAYKRAKFPKPRNIIGLTKSLPRVEMEKLMLANAPAGEAELRLLAEERAKTVAQWLRDRGKIPAERVFLLPPKMPGEPGGPKDAPQNRAEFSLK
jgi:hypothetical protein